MRKSILAALTMVTCFAMGSIAFADVTGDFKVTGSSYVNPGTEAGGDVTVSGSFNRGAAQSGKKVEVDLTYSVAYQYAIADVETVQTPGPCNDSAYYSAHKNGCDNANHEHSSLWIGTTTTETVTHVFNDTTGMTVNTEPTVTNGRLNPKGKITGYNFKADKSFIPSELVPALPAGATLTDAEMVSISFTAYLIDAQGIQIADTVVTGTLY